jgi:tetratricopeptide (TPR) repeat protein
MTRIPLLALGATLLLVLQIPAGFAASSYEDASKSFKQGNYAEALEKVESVITANPRDARARFLKGLILTEQSKPAEAIKEFTSLTEDYPELPEPYNNLAVLYASQGQYDKARKALEMAIRTHPSYAIAHENLGDVYAKMASEAYDKALQLDRGNAAAQTKLAMIKDLFSGSVVPGRGSPDTPDAAPPVVASVTTEKPAPAAKAAAVAAPTAVPLNKGDVEGALAAVNGWAKAWSSKNPDGYLAFYAPSFQVPGGEARSSWETMRRDRIVRPKKIEVTISSPKVTFDAAGRAIVKFRQGYKSDTLDTAGAKTLVLQKNNNHWQIVQERMN